MLYILKVMYLTWNRMLFYKVLFRNYKKMKLFIFKNRAYCNFRRLFFTLRKTEEEYIISVCFPIRMYWWVSVERVKIKALVQWEKLRSQYVFRYTYNLSNWELFLFNYDIMAGRARSNIDHWWHSTGLAIMREQQSSFA